MKNQQINNKALTPRPPIVVVMGHVDHGKSTLLDFLRNTNVVAGEAGGITQHIGAYEVETKNDGKNRKITLLDTPGHAAFSQMRLRGASVADIAVLVVAADDGVQSQTIEAHKSIKEAGLPYLVALNKIDKPGTDPEKIKTQLAENGIYVEGYGGDIPYVKISAKTGEGVPEMLEIILLLADLANLKADAEINASGIVIESNRDPQRGISSTLIIKNGIMKKGMNVVAGCSFAPVRIFENFFGQTIKEASFSSPVKITGFNKLPVAGSEFKTYLTKNEAEEAIASFKNNSPALIKDCLKKEIEKDENKVTIKMVVKTDTTGSLEALEKELTKLKDEKTLIYLVKGGVGNVNEDDARFASTSKQTVVLGFNVEADATAKEIMERNEVLFFRSNIIYEISDWLKQEITKKKAEIPQDETIGAAKILKTFSRQKNKQVIGGKVISGKNFKIKRKDIEIGEGKIINVQREKKETRQVDEGFEFGALTENKIEITKDDEIIILGK